MTAAPAVIQHTPAVLWSNEAEQSILGALMLASDSFQRIEGKLVPEDFFARGHQIIFRAIIRLNSDRQPVDVVTVAEFLDNQKRRSRKSEDENLLEEIGGVAYLGILVRDLGSPANIRAYADIVRNRSILRQLAGLSAKTLEAVHYPDGRDPGDIIAEAEQQLLELSQGRAKARSEFTGTNELMTMAVDRIDQLFNLQQLITGIPVGWHRFDMLTSGLQRKDLIIIAARPSMGKTTFAMNIGASIAAKEELPVAIFSMEMAKEQLTLKMISSCGRINHQRVRTGQLEEDDWCRLTTAITFLNNKPLFINDTPALRASEVASHARALHREKNGLGAIIVDYIQLMAGDAKSENRNLEVGQITGRLKQLAKDLDCPVIALSQLNRSLEQRRDKRPVMSDLRDSGSIEQDADVVIFLYQDAKYNADTIDQDKELGYVCAEVIVSKQRNGETATLPFNFYGQYQRFEEHENEYLPSWIASPKYQRKERFTDEVE